jgi:hypothetical protein
MLVSLADMKTFLGISGNTYDAFLTLQITLVSDAIEGYCGRKFASDEYTQTFYQQDFDWKYPKTMTLFHYPVTEIDTIVEMEEEGGDETAIEDYTTHEDTGTLTKRAGLFFQNGKILEVVYTAGYATIPAVIQNVVYSLVQEKYNKKINGIDLNFGADVQRISIPGTISIDFDYSLNNNERKSHYGSILGSYINNLDAYRSERSVVGSVRLNYVAT